MKLGDVLTNVGTTALTAVNPVIGGSIAALVNAFMPDDGKIDLDNSGQDILNKINMLPEAERQKLLGQNVQIQVQLSKERVNQSNNELLSTRALTDNDVTKRAIELSLNTVVCTIAVYGIMLALLIIIQTLLVSFSSLPLARINALGDLLPDWDVMAAMIGIPSFVIRSIFAFRNKDTMTVANTVVGQPTNGVGKQLKDIITGARSK